MNWNHEMIMDLIDLYKEEPVLWDRNHRSFDDEKKSYRAWERIGKKLVDYSVKVEDLQQKMFSVERMYRRYNRGENIPVIPQDRDYMRMLDSFLGKTSTHNTTTNSTQKLRNTDWTLDKEQDLIELYQVERVLWDPNHCWYREDIKRNEAWGRLSEHLNIPVPDLKERMASLIAMYRKDKRENKCGDKNFVKLDCFLGKVSASNTATNSTQVENIGDVQGVKVEGAAAAPQVEDSCSHCGKSLVEKFLQLPERERLNMMLEICGTLKHKLDVK